MQAGDGNVANLFWQCRTKICFLWRASLVFSVWHWLVVLGLQQRDDIGLLYSNEWRVLPCEILHFADDRRLHTFTIQQLLELPEANSWAAPARESGTDPPHKLTVHHGTNHTVILLQLSWAGRRPAPAILHIRNNPNFFSDYIVAATAKNCRYRWEVLCYEVPLWSLARICKGLWSPRNRFCQLM